MGGSVLPRNRETKGVQTLHEADKGPTSDVAANVATWWDLPPPPQQVTCIVLYFPLQMSRRIAEESCSLRGEK